MICWVDRQKNWYEVNRTREGNLDDESFSFELCSMLLHTTIGVVTESKLADHLASSFYPHTHTRFLC